MSASETLERFLPTNVRLVDLVDSTALELALGADHGIDERLVADAVRIARAAYPQTTIRTYRTNVGTFEQWADTNGFLKLPASGVTIALYLADNADRLKVSTLRNKVASISFATKRAGLVPATNAFVVHEMLRGASRLYHYRPRRMRPIRPAMLRKLVRCARSEANEMRGRRDAALLLCAFLGALRSINVTSLDFADIEFTEEGLKITLQGSKTDPLRWGEVICISKGLHAETCAVQALKEWITHAKITSGPLFRAVHRSGSVRPKGISTRAFYNILTSYITKIGTQAKGYGTHSLRSGFLTTGFEMGIDEADLMHQSLHRSFKCFLGYLSDANFLRRNLTVGIGM